MRFNGKEYMKSRCNGYIEQNLIETGYEIHTFSEHTCVFKIGIFKFVTSIKRVM